MTASSAFSKIDMDKVTYDSNGKILHVNLNAKGQKQKNKKMKDNNFVTV